VLIVVDEVTPLASQKIWTFYRNVAKKYRNTFDAEDIVKSAQKAIRNMGQIEQTLGCRKPTLHRWKHFHMAHAGKLYYAYGIHEDVITIEDACHEQNMYE
jgi:hypothetical protein